MFDAKEVEVSSFARLDSLGNVASTMQDELKGLARTQIPTNRNDDVEFPTFGEIAGVNHSVVQWSSLALEEPPS